LVAGLAASTGTCRPGVRAMETAALAPVAQSSTDATLSGACSGRSSARSARTSFACSAALNEQAARHVLLQPGIEHGTQPSVRPQLCPRPLRGRHAAPRGLIAFAEPVFRPARKPKGERALRAAAGRWRPSDHGVAGDADASPVVERGVSGVAVVAGRVGGPRRIADDLLPTNGPKLVHIGPGWRD
jgi:hypothetical protein